MTQLALSTAICSLPQDSAGILRSWEEKSQGRIPSLAIDSRLSLALQADVLQLSSRRGLICAEITHSFTGEFGRPAASIVSADRDELRHARAQIIATLELAHRFEVHRVILSPGRINLKMSESDLRRRFLLGLEWENEPLLQERHSLAVEALDHLCLVLDPVLAAAEKYDLQIVWLSPTFFLHQIPGPNEVRQLLEIFAGSPISICFCTDWAQLAKMLQTGSLDHLTQSKFSCLRLADACGITGRLPLGRGEIIWPETLKAIHSARDHVLTFHSGTTEQELMHSLTFYESWCSSQLI